MIYLQPNGRVTSEYLVRLVKLSVEEHSIMPANGIVALAKEVVERRLAEERPPNGEERIHIVGPGHIVGTRQRQLCAWCGFQLVNEDLALIASSDGRGMGFWQEGKLISVTTYGMSILEQGPGSDLPANACAAPPPAAPPPPALRVVR
jgi:hypothetical protein